MKKYINIYCIVFFALVVSGCKKQLDALPNDALVEGNSIINQQTANIALNGVYYRLANATATSTNWLPSQINGGILSGYMADGNNTTNEETNKLGTTGMSREWSLDYTTINAANGVISGVNKVGDDLFVNGRKQQILAEARFLRAFAHFKLLLYFGQWDNINSNFGVILRKDFITATNYPQARAGVKESYDFILDDINYAIDNGAATSTNIYANKWTAMALKMRVLLSRGQNDDYAQCATLGNTIINSGPYKLENNLKDIFYTKGLTSTEVMLGIQPQPNQSAYYYNTSGNYVVRSSYYVVTNAFNTLVANDPRKTWIVGNAGARNKGFYFIKYVTPTLTTTQISEVGYAFRLSEIYLMQAEAMVRSAGVSVAAKNLLKTIMGKAGITDFTTVDAAATSDDLLKQIYYEYVKNFIGEEGISYWALLRFPLATVTQLRPTITDKNQYIFPIPKEEFINNPLIVDQNPGYSK
ncbi:RagB/SusD family nutrient uptake outer membrane protein [Pedobacter sp. UBA5917]|jgi:hypothetical protein|uniref:RagB/SusD family nutrient uptake outer membrane protein n=1 Tax=Pedobacter sp. UBA5917 TaxID=1947061 RepID=UPI0025D1805F|nr:RagB/SusD family nutrient uptake outer membrane protein [Pedobacter sp. UBA5917]